MRLHVHQVRICGVVVTRYGSVNRSSYITAKSVLWLPVKILDTTSMQPVRNMIDVLARYNRRNPSGRPVVVERRLLSRRSVSSSVHSESFTMR